MFVYGIKGGTLSFSEDRRRGGAVDVQLKGSKCAAEIEKCQRSPQSPDHQLHRARSQAMPASRAAAECEIRHININEVHYSPAFSAKTRLRMI